MSSFVDPRLITRRSLLRAGSVGAMALATLLRGGQSAAARPRAKRVIFLFQSGGPSQLDLFEHKPAVARLFDTELPESVRRGQRLTGMTSGQTRLPVAPSLFQFQRHGESGAWCSELVPHLGGVADDLCFVRSMQTDAINHDPAITFFQTG